MLCDFLSLCFTREPGFPDWFLSIFGQFQDLPVSKLTKSVEKVLEPMTVKTCFLKWRQIKLTFLVLQLVGRKLWMFFSNRQVCHQIACHTCLVYQYNYSNIRNYFPSISVHHLWTIPTSNTCNTSDNLFPIASSTCRNCHSKNQKGQKILVSWECWLDLPAKQSQKVGCWRSWHMRSRMPAKRECI